MDGYWRLLVVCLVVLTTVTAVPHTKRDGACMAAGELADTLFHQMVSKYRPYFNIPEMFSEVLDMNYDNFTFTEIICPLEEGILFEGVYSVDDVINELDLDDRLFGIFKGFYDYMVVSLIHTKAYYIKHERYREESDLIRALEASNITRLDPEGVAWLFEATGGSGGPGGDVFPEPEPMSTKPLDIESRDIANLMRKVWNKMVKNGPFNELSGVYYREELYNTTGIYLPQGSAAHGVMIDLVFHTLRASYDLYYLYDHVFREKFLCFLVSQEYGRAVRHLKRDYLDHDSNDYGYNYGYNEGNEQVKELIGLLNDIGLLDLELMTETYPYFGEPFVNPYDGGSF